MTYYDATANRITVDETHRSMMQGSGEMFLFTMSLIANDPSASAGLKADWKVIKWWLDITDNVITKEQQNKFGVGYLSYLQECDAPSKDLESSFQLSKEKAIEENWPRIPLPLEIKPVLDRMFATDKQIADKKLASKPEKIGGAVIPASNKPTIDQNKLFKAMAILWVFISIPLSEHIYDEHLDGGLFMRIFILAAVSTPVWLVYGWRWLTNNASIPFKLWGSVIAGLIIYSIFLSDDRYYDDIAYIPLTMALALFVMVWNYERTWIKSKISKLTTPYR